jgi:PAS domain S-box-containing protein
LVTLVVCRGRGEAEAARDRSAAELRRSTERYQLFVARSPVAMFRSGLDGRLLDVNPAFLRLFGFSSSATALATSAAELYSRPADRARILEELARGSQATNQVAIFRRRDGSELVGLLTARIVEEEGGPSVEGQILDVTQARETERLRMVSALAQAAAHEINNPLTPLLGDVQLLQADGALSESTLRRLARVARSAERIRDIVAAMQHLTRVKLAPTSASNLPPMIDLRRSAGTGGEDAQVQPAPGQSDPGDDR